MFKVNEPNVRNPDVYVRISDNRTILENAEIRTSRFRTVTVPCLKSEVTSVRIWAQGFWSFTVIKISQVVFEKLDLKWSRLVWILAIFYSLQFELKVLVRIPNQFGIQTFTVFANTVSV